MPKRDAITIRDNMMGQKHFKGGGGQTSVWGGGKNILNIIK